MMPRITVSFTIIAHCTIRLIPTVNLITSHGSKLRNINDHQGKLNSLQKIYGTTGQTSLNIKIAEPRLQAV